MSKMVKELVTNQLKQAWSNVGDMLCISVDGLSANANAALRKELRAKNIQMMMVKRSLARRATEGTQLAPMFEGSSGSMVVVWGASDVVALAKEVTRLVGDKKFAPIAAKGGVMDGARLSSSDVGAVSKWPSREEQLSILVGQILAPGALLVSQLTSAGGALASQIKEHAGGDAEISGGPETGGPETGGGEAGA